MLKLVVFELVAIILNIITYCLNGMNYIKIVLLIGRSVLFYPGGALWYIQAVLVAVLILKPIIRKNMEWLAVVIGMVLYGFALLCNRYYFVVADSPAEKIVKLHNKIFVSSRNGACYGLLFVAIGMLISKNWERISSKRTVMAIGLSVSYLLLIFEFFLIRGKPGTEDASLHIMMIVVCPLLFIVAAQYDHFPLDTRRIRNLSTSIYLLHSPLISILNIFGIMITGERLPCLLLNMLLFVSITILIAAIYHMKKSPFYKLVI